MVFKAEGWQGADFIQIAPVSICEDGNELSGAIKCREYLD
jgi:hypothetical protein